MPDFHTIRNSMKGEWSMNEQYINDVIDYLKAEYPENYMISAIKNRKNNGQELQGVVIRDMTAPNNTAPIMYLDEYYVNGLEADETAIMIMEDYEAVKNTTVPFDVSEIVNFEAVKDRIFFRLVNRNYNEADLQDKPYYEFAQDLAVLFYVDLAYAVADVTNALYDIWGVDEDVLLEVAKQNAKRKYPAEVIPVAEAVVQEYSDMQIAVMKTESGCVDLSNDEFRQLMIESQQDDVPLYVWRAKNKFGASVLLYDEIERIQERIGNKFYILPSSIGEVLILPYEEEYRVSELKKMVAEVNSQYLHPEQILSENVYIVTEQGEIFVAKENIQRQQAVAR